jgi:hypothetical protein
MTNYRKTRTVKQRKPLEKPSDQQKNIFKWGEHPEENEKQNAIIVARAGVGKTTTLAELVHRVPEEKVLMAFFNSHLVPEVEEKVGYRKGVDILTFNSVGNRIVQRPQNWQGITLITQSGGRGRILAESICQKYEMDTGINVPYNIVYIIGALCNKGREITPFPSQQDMESLAWKFTLIPDRSLWPKGFDVPFVAQMAIKCMELATDKNFASKSGYDYVDQIFLPVRMGWMTGDYDMVMIDEAQDLNPIMHMLAIGVCKKEGRIVVCGDPFQCIPYDEVVYTPNGYRQITDINIGDTVYSVKNGIKREAKVINKTGSMKSIVLRFELDNGTSMRMTPDHVGFASIDDPMGGAYVYLMYKKGFGFRIGASQKTGTKGDSIKCRTQQETADRLWILGWYPTAQMAIFNEERLSLKYGIPTTPFRTIMGTWFSDASLIKNFFEEFGNNGIRLLEDRGIPFDKPNYIPRSSGSNRVTINLLIGTKDFHKIECESSNIPQNIIENFGFTVGKKGVTYRLRKNYRSLTDATTFANRLAESLRFNGCDARIVESLACTEDRRRMFSVAASSIYPGMSVPVIDEKGNISTAQVVNRTEENYHSIPCYDLQIEDLGTFIIGNSNTIVHNCLYDWRGADSNALARLKIELDAQEFPLTVTYRCGKKIVELAKEYVPDYEAAPGNPDGEIVDLYKNEMTESLTPGDLILSRTSAPLAKLALSLIREGKHVKLAGKKIGAGLTALIRQLATYDAKTDITAFFTKLSNWEKVEVEKINTQVESKGPEWVSSQIETIRDKADTIRFFGENINSTPELINYIENLFVDKYDRPHILLSTVHKAKGSEAKRVFILAETLRDNTEEELHICYVAITRAINYLAFVYGVVTKNRKYSDTAIAEVRKSIDEVTGPNRDDIYPDDEEASTREGTEDADNLPINTWIEQLASQERARKTQVIEKEDEYDDVIRDCPF